MYCSCSWISRALSTGSSGVFGHVTCSTLTASADASANVFHGSGLGSVFAADAVHTRTVSRAEPSSADPGPLIVVVVLTRSSSPRELPGTDPWRRRRSSIQRPTQVRKAMQKIPRGGRAEILAPRARETTGLGAMPPRHPFPGRIARLGDDRRIE